MRLIYEIDGRAGGFTILVFDADRAPLDSNTLRRIMNKLSPLDMAIIREVLAANMFGQLNSTQLAGMLPLLAQRDTLIEESKLRYDEESLRPHVRIEKLAGGYVIHMLLLDAAGVPMDVSTGRLIAGSSAAFLRNGWAFPVETPAPWLLNQWAIRPQRHIHKNMSVAERDDIVRQLVDLGVPEEALEEIKTRRGPPEQFSLDVEAMEDENGEPMALVRCRVQYPGWFTWLTPPSQSGDLERGDDGAIERDLASEREALDWMRSRRLSYDAERGGFLARGETALAVLDGRSGFFPSDWLRSDVGHGGIRLRTGFAMDAEITRHSDSGLLALQLNIHDEDELINALVDMKSLLKQIQAGAKYLKLKDGSYIPARGNTVHALMALGDLGVMHTEADVSPMCVGVLHSLSDLMSVKATDEATQAWLLELSEHGGPQEVPIPPRLDGVLRDYQRQGFYWLMMLHRHHLGGVLADDMGLGKTLQTLALLSAITEFSGGMPSLVIAPTSVLTVWRDEVEKFAPELKCVLWYGGRDKRRAINIEDYDLVITSYGTLRQDLESLQDKKFYYLILDEAQQTKNRQSRSAHAVRSVNAKHRLALSGTPIENRPEELWSLFDFLAPGFLGSADAFRRRYAKPISQGSQIAADVLRARVRPFILRRRKDTVAKELPPKQTVIARCTMGPMQRALYEHVAGTLRDSLSERLQRLGVEQLRMDILAALTRLRQICCDPALIAGSETPAPPSAKLELFGEIVREAVGSGRAIVVFSQFVSMQKRLVQAIRQHAGVDPLWLHGKTRDRDKVVAAFQDPSGPPVIVVSLRAGGTGITLTRADTVIHYEPWWNPAVEEQATDRTHRIGQLHPVLVYRLICSDSIEERVQQLAQSKRDLADTLLNQEASGDRISLSSADVLSLLR